MRKNNKISFHRTVCCFVLIVLFIPLFFVNASAAGRTVTIKDLGIDCTIPDCFTYVFTRDNIGDADAASLGMTKTEVKNLLTESNAYYDHLHTLFAMFRLSKKQQDIIRNLTLTPVKGIPARLFGRWMGFSNLNSINDLIKLGFIEAQPGHRISLHLMMREVALSEFPPSIAACHTMLESIRFQCQLHGIDPVYYKLMHQTVLNTVLEAKKDDTAFYLRFLEDTLESFDKYRDEAGVQLLLGELDALLSDPLVGNAVDRAILIESHAFCEKDDQKAINMMLDALKLLPEVNKSNALAVSNLHANIGDLYRRLHQNEPARQHMETAMTLLEDYGLFGTHDSLTQVVSYANYLDAVGETDAAVAALKKVEPIIRRINPDSLDHASILESIGCCLLPKEETVGDGRTYLMQAMEIYESVWSDEPQLIEEKRRDFLKAHMIAGVEITKETEKLLNAPK